jgi:uncharacterized protein
MEPNTASHDEPDLNDPRVDDQDAQPANPSLRTCVVTRAELTPDDLIRFVVGPDGAVVPDLARRLPGRGVWVTLDRKAVEKAIKIKAFARSMKRQVTASPELPALIERLLVKRSIEALSLANKAGLVLTGFGKVEAELTRAPLALMHATDAAEDGCHKLNRKWVAINADLNRSALIIGGLTIEQLSLAIGRENVVHTCLRPGGAAARFVDAISRTMRYRTGLSPGLSPGFGPGDGMGDGQQRPSGTTLSDAGEAAANGGLGEVGRG